MNFQEYLDNKGITKYHLSKLSGVPKTTISDICSGKSSLSKCSGKTLLLLSKALGCNMEDLMKMEENNSSRYDENTGLPLDKSYLEKDLPPFLQKSLDQMIATWKILDSGGTSLQWDLDWCELNSDINFAEVDQQISKEQAAYLREKYLRMVNE